MTANDPDPKFRWERYLLWCGVFYGTLQLLTLVIFALWIGPSMPPIGSPAEHYSDFYIQQGSAILTASYLLAAPSPFFLLFLGGLYSIVRRCGSAAIPLAMTALASGSAAIMLWPAIPSMLSWVTISVAYAHGDPSVVRGLDALCPSLLSVSAFPRAVFLFATSALLHERKLAANWIAIAGHSIAVLTLIGSAFPLWAPLLFTLLAAAVASFTWIAIAALGLARRCSVAASEYANTLKPHSVTRTPRRCVGSQYSRRASTWAVTERDWSFL